MAVKYVFVTGGVVSGLGKGITAASLGRLLKARGYHVTMQKFDPYINIDPGTMNPIQHGEVFVTDDGIMKDLSTKILTVIPMLLQEKFIGLSSRKKEEETLVEVPFRLFHILLMKSRVVFTEMYLTMICILPLSKLAVLSAILKASLS